MAVTVPILSTPNTFLMNNPLSGLYEEHSFLRYRQRFINIHCLSHTCRLWPISVYRDLLWSIFWGSLSYRLLPLDRIIKMSYLIFLTKFLLLISLIFSCDSATETCIKSKNKMDAEFIGDYPSFLTQWPTIHLSTSTSLLTRHQPRVLTRNSNSIHVPLQQVHQCVSRTPIPIVIISRLCDFSLPTLGMLTLFITSLSHGLFTVLL